MSLCDKRFQDAAVQIYNTRAAYSQEFEFTTVNIIIIMFVYSYTPCNSCAGSTLLHCVKNIFIHIYSSPFGAIAVKTAKSQHIYELNKNRKFFFKSRIIDSERAILKWQTTCDKRGNGRSLG